jgi:hypothetical protein
LSPPSPKAGEACRWRKKKLSNWKGSRSNKESNLGAERRNKVGLRLARLSTLVWRQAIEFGSLSGAQLSAALFHSRCRLGRCSALQRL